MRLGSIKPKLKVHGVDGNGETACGWVPLRGRGAEAGRHHLPPLRLPPAVQEAVS